MTAKKAVVIGGGLAGLTGGYLLSKAGWEVTLLEPVEEVGGRVRTVRKQGYTLDVGATQMSSGYREYLGLCAEIGLGGQMVTSSSRIGILRHGRIHVIDGDNMLSGVLSPVLGLRSKLTLLNTVNDMRAIRPSIDVFDVSRSHAVDIESAAEYAQRRLNRELFDVLVDPLIRAYVMNAAQNVSALEWFSALKNLGGQKMLSLNGGNDILPKALQQRIRVRLAARATGITKTRAGVEVTCEDAGGKQMEIDSRACILATRLPEAMTIYPPARDKAGRLGERLRYNRAWVVQLGYCNRPQSPIVGVLLPRVEQPEVGLLWLEHNKNPDRVPPGHALFSVYSDEAANDVCFARSDEELVRSASDFVETLFPELKGHCEMTHVTRWPMAIPNTAPGIYKDMFAMKERLDPADSVQLAGDYFTCTGQNSAIFYGRRAAENVLAHHS